MFLSLDAGSCVKTYIFVKNAGNLFLILQNLHFCYKFDFVHKKVYNE